jgi:hypothetical protein
MKTQNKDKNKKTQRLKKYLKTVLILVGLFEHSEKAEW